MTLTIKEVKKLPRRAYGQFKLVSAGRGQILVSKDMNSLLAEYGATVLHELLHFYFAMLRLHGFKVSDRREHKAVYAAEKLVIKSMRRYCRG